MTMGWATHAMETGILTALEAAFQRHVFSYRMKWPFSQESMKDI